MMMLKLPPLTAIKIVGPPLFELEIRQIFQVRYKQLTLNPRSDTFEFAITVIAACTVVKRSFSILVEDVNLENKGVIILDFIGLSQKLKPTDIVILLVSILLLSLGRY